MAFFLVQKWVGYIIMFLELLSLAQGSNRLKNIKRQCARKLLSMKMFEKVCQSKKLKASYRSK